MPNQGEQLWLQNAAFIWVPLIVVGAMAAWFGMNDIADSKSSFREQAVIFRRRDNWLMCWLYMGMFGSFIGFAAGFPLLSGMQFPAVDPVKYAFLGSAGRRAHPAAGRRAGRQAGRRPGYLLDLCGDDPGRRRRAALPAG